ncbi:cache domain-containing protein [Desulfovibrio mangrovi]|uniref:sensor histidine kinase n=1 Tax=Desulfovibrio mangrovi TaxID=2976983 RepID=UPI002245098A|nr:cache domain-containing protein [Desulfovibrio mangrovi]UZP66187.1 cache domain-containing protein [Desulfovibrio mangrovi]
MSPSGKLRALLQTTWVKIALPIVISVVLIFGIIFAIQIPNTYNALLERKKVSLKDNVMIAWNIIQFCYTLELQGKIPEGKGQEMAIQSLARMRFGPELKDYFWINDTRPYMIMHPYLPELEGMNLSDYMDATGKRLFVEMVQTSSQTGSSFVSYQWQWQDKANLILPKISFVKRFEPWQWIIGTGAYLEDIRQETMRQTREMVIASTVALCIIISLSLFSIAQARKASQRITENEAKMRKVFSQAEEALFILATDGTILQSNQAATEVIGFAPIQSARFEDIPWVIKDSDGTEERQSMLEKARSGILPHFEAEFTRQDGENRYLDGTVVPITDEEDTVLYLLVSAMDITERIESQNRLEELNATLEERVRERTEELANSLDTLKKAQDQLVVTEKMAALGRLVAGVAHEINTPLGLGVTNATYLQERLAAIRESYEAGKFTKGEFEAFLKTADSAAESMLLNLTRGAEIIRSFKQVAVDQELEQTRAFNLHDYFREVQLSVQPKFKHSPHKLEVECPEDIILKTYPGALTQVLTNLIMNALIHAFDEDMAGLARLSARIVPAGVEITFSDNGKGMNDEQKTKIFDPFFTTRQGQGGTGLGMHITYNLVTQKLCGVIQLESALGKGTTFRITIPLEHQDMACPPVLENV